MEYNGSNQVIIEGFAYSDQDILKLINNLSKQKLVEQASLSSMQLPNVNRSQGGIVMKGFRIYVKVKNG